MYKRSKRLIAVSVATMMLFSSMAVSAGQKYDSSNVGISTKVDEYIEDGNSVNELTGDKGTQTTVKQVVYDSSKKTEKKTPEKKKSSNSQFEDRAIITADGVVNIRAEASEDSEIIGTIPTGGIMNVEQKGPEWSLIASGNCYGYVKNDFIAFGDDAAAWAEKNELAKIAVVNVQTLNVRVSPDADSDCITMIPEGDVYDIVSQENGWVCISVDGQDGYVKAEYVDIKYKTYHATTVEEEKAEEAARKASEESQAQEESQENTETEDSSSSNETESSYSESSNDNDSTDDSGSSSSSSDESYDDSESSSSDDSAESAPTQTVVNDGISSTKQDLVNYALQFVGNPYVYGGESLTNGTDCSGFTMLIYRAYGISLPHGATSQSYYGTPISLSDIEPGDLLFYLDDEGDYGHVTMYIGNGQVVHASSPSTGIIISDISYRTPSAARRYMD